MKQTLYILVLSILIMSLSGCKIDGRNQFNKYYIRSYIMEYFETSNVTLVPSSYYLYDITMEIRRGEVLCDYNDEGERKMLYETLSEKYGDTSFDRTVKIPYWITDPSAQAYSFVSIEITSDTDFDETHPTGTSLADLVMIHYRSIKPFIDSGYEGYRDNSDPSRYSTRFDKHLSEIDADDLKLLYLHWGNKIDVSLSFDRRPTLSKVHTFTVTCTDDRGKVFFDSIEMTFE